MWERNLSYSCALDLSVKNSYCNNRSRCLPNADAIFELGGGDDLAANCQLRQLQTF